MKNGEGSEEKISIGWDASFLWTAEGAEAAEKAILVKVEIFELNHRDTARHSRNKNLI